MSLGGINCPYCRNYNPKEDTHCNRCGRRMPPAFLVPVLGEFGQVSFPVSKVLGGLCVAIFILQAVSNYAITNNLADMVGSGRSSVLLRFGALFTRLASAEPWRLLTYSFVHIGIIHLGMNGLGLSRLGPLVEEFLGSVRMLFLYMVSGLVGGLASVYWYAPAGVLTAGASGSIFGLLGSDVARMVVLRQPGWKGRVIQNIILCAAMGVMMQVNNAAHFAGALTGFVLGALFAYEKRPQRRTWFVGLLAGALSLATIAGLLASQASPAWKALARIEAERERERSMGE